MVRVALPRRRVVIRRERCFGKTRTVGGGCWFRGPTCNHCWNLSKELHIIMFLVSGLCNRWDSGFRYIISVCCVIGLSTFVVDTEHFTRSYSFSLIVVCVASKGRHSLFLYSRERVLYYLLLIYEQCCVPVTRHISKWIPRIKVMDWIRVHRNIS